jgi:hypothetical protein
MKGNMLVRKICLTKIEAEMAKNRIIELKQKEYNRKVDELLSN